MNIDENLLHKLEKLSALRISAEKKEQVIQELSEIVNFVEVLNELDLNAFEKTTTIITGANPLRKDEVKNSAVIKDIFKYAPQSEDGFFVVPKIIE